jgi:hypothetical protein
MRTRSPLIVVAAAVAFSSAATTAVAQTGDPLGIADRDSVYIDAKSFKIVPGKAKGDTSALIEKLDARKLGPGTIVFRLGNQLFIADATPIISERTDRNGSDSYGSDRYGSDRYGSDRYGSDRYGSDRDTSVSAAQAEHDWQESQRSLRQNPRYGSDRYGSDRYGSDRYGSDRDTSVSAAQAERDWQESQRSLRQNPRYGSDRYGMESAQQHIDDSEPDYAQYKVKKTFQTYWTTGDSE